MSDFNCKEAKESLKHVFWIGGSAGGGKTTISKRIAEDYGFFRYNGDGYGPGHMDNASENECPALFKIRSGGENFEERFVEYFRWLLFQKPEEMVKALLDFYRDDFLMAAKELLDKPSDNPIIVDLGFGYPIKELRKLIEKERAIFLVATGKYRMQVFEERNFLRPGSTFPKALEGHPNQKEIVFSGFVEAIRLLTEYTQRKCETHDLPLLVTGGRMTVDETYESVCRHFGI